MAATAEERIPALKGSEDIFSLAVPSASRSENRIDKNAPEGEKSHQGIFSRNRTIASGATWAKWPRTHQDRKCSWSKTVVGSALDANGNTLTDASGKSYTWDFENRLVQAVVPGTNGGTTTFKYDPFGRRIQKSGPLGTTNYLYDGADLSEEIDSSGNVLARYTDGRGIDQPLSMLRGGTNAYYLSDGIRSITSLSNSAGTLLNTYTYDSFGKQTASSGTLTNPFRYTGREFDQETGIYFYRHRYYDPQTGRFASEDPAMFFGGNNFYDYVLNDPTDLVDPTGLWGSFGIHGNWCGPGWTGGHWESYDPAHDTSGPSGPYYNGPIDYTDSVCRDHDMCYYDCRRDHKCDQGSRRNCMRQCDHNLIYELTRFPGRFEGTIDALAGVIVTGGIAADAYYPNAGDNDKSCPNCQKK
jgi:RHS repeat-associated protein